MLFIRYFISPECIEYIRDTRLYTERENRRRHGRMNRTERDKIDIHRTEREEISGD